MFDGGSLDALASPKRRLTQAGLSSYVTTSIALTKDGVPRLPQKGKRLPAAILETLTLKNKNNSGKSGSCLSNSGAENFSLIKFSRTCDFLPRCRDTQPNGHRGHCCRELPAIDRARKMTVMNTAPPSCTHLSTAFPDAAT